MPIRFGSLPAKSVDVARETLDLRLVNNPISSSRGPDFDSKSESLCTYYHTALT